MKAHVAPISMVKTPRNFDDNWPRYHRISSENFCMLDFLLQAVMSILNVV